MNGVDCLCLSTNRAGTVAASPAVFVHACVSPRWCDFCSLRRFDDSHPWSISLVAVFELFPRRPALPLGFPDDCLLSSSSINLMKLSSASAQGHTHPRERSDRIVSRYWARTCIVASRKRIQTYNDGNWDRPLLIQHEIESISEAS